jgi:CO/xanthine dehydrogenase FAD-binding subunit
VPRALPEALTLLAQEGSTPLAGATDLFVLMNAGHLKPTRFVSLHGVPELSEAARWDGDRYVMSALTSYTEARHDAGVRARLPLLALAAREVGALQIQNRGTWAGNIANASPAADGVPALLAYDATWSCPARAGRARWRCATTSRATSNRSSSRRADRRASRCRRRGRARGTTGARSARASCRRSPRSSPRASLVVDGTIRTRALALGSVAPIPLRARTSRRR